MNRHPVDIVSLVFGLLFAAVATMGLAGRVVVGLADLRWILPGVLVLVGVALLVSSSRNGSDDLVGGGDSR